MTDDQIKKNPKINSSTSKDDSQTTSATQGTNYTPIQQLINKSDDQIKTATLTKEGEPIDISAEKIDTSKIEVIDTEPVIEDKEIAKFIEVNRDDPQIHPELKKAGLLSVNTSSLDPKYKIQLPISDEKVIEGLHKPVTTSFRWLAEFALFMLKQAHLTLKEIHGKVVRVLQK